MKLATHTLQQLVNQRGADLRGIVLDDTGQIVGVGRRTNVPPGWLREAAWARDTAVRDPDGTCPVRRADLDHIDPWPHGPTDEANLAPIGRRFHNHKTSRHRTSPVPVTAPPPGLTAATAGPSDSPRPNATCNGHPTPDHPAYHSMTSNATRPDRDRSCQLSHPWCSMKA